MLLDRKVIISSESIVITRGLQEPLLIGSLMLLAPNADEFTLDVEMFGGISETKLLDCMSGNHKSQD